MGNDFEGLRETLRVGISKLEKLSNNDIEKINDNIKLLEKQKEVEELKYQISTSIRRLEDIVGREAVKDYLSQFPLAF